MEFPRLVCIPVALALTLATLLSKPATTLRDFDSLEIFDKNYILHKAPLYSHLRQSRPKKFKACYNGAMVVNCDSPNATDTPTANVSSSTETGTPSSTEAGNPSTTELTTPSSTEPTDSPSSNTQVKREEIKEDESLLEVMRRARNRAPPPASRVLDVVEDYPTEVKPTVFTTTTTSPPRKIFDTVPLDYSGEITNSSQVLAANENDTLASLMDHSHVIVHQDIIQAVIDIHQESVGENETLPSGLNVTTEDEKNAEIITTESLPLTTTTTTTTTITTTLNLKPQETSTLETTTTPKALLSDPDSALMSGLNEYPDYEQMEAPASKHAVS